jgi:hypothetical protein
MKKKRTIDITLTEKSTDGKILVQVKRKITIEEFKEYMESLPQEQRVEFSKQILGLI